MRPLTVTRWIEDEGDDDISGQQPVWSREVTEDELKALAREDVEQLKKRMDELFNLACETGDRQVRAGIARQREHLADHIESIKAARASLEYTARQRLRNHENYVQRLPDYEVTATRELLAELEQEPKHVW